MKLDKITAGIRFRVNSEYDNSIINLTIKTNQNIQDNTISCSIFILEKATEH